MDEDDEDDNDDAMTMTCYRMLLLGVNYPNNLQETHKYIKISVDRH